MSTVTFHKKDLQGSRLRCLMLTSLSPASFASCLNALIAPHGTIAPTTDYWMPLGFLAPSEAKIGQSEMFLSEVQRKDLRSWWLATGNNPNIPNWDLVSTCSIAGRKGLVVVEAKAHVSEFEMSPKKRGPDTNEQNEARIRTAILEADTALNRQLPGFALSIDTHYQISNRFAWSWKIASLGVPVILVYLGFLDAAELAGKKTLPTGETWSQAVLARSEGIIPAEAWSARFDVNGTPLRALIRAIEVHGVPVEHTPQSWKPGHCREGRVT